MRNLNKLPVAQTINRAYGFVFGRIGTLVRITWVPAVLSAVLGFVIDRNSLRFQDAAEGGGEDAGLYLLMGSLSLTTSLFLSAVAASGIIREVLAPGTARGNFYFPTGRTELRLFMANLRMTLAITALVVLAFLVTIAALAIAGVNFMDAEEPPATLATAAAGMVALASFVYVAVSALRLAFFLPAAVVVETGAGLRRAHALSEGNFFRALIVLIAILIPIVTFLVLGQFALLLFVEGAGVFQQPVEAVREAIQAAIREHLLVWEIFGAFVFMLTSGLLYSASAYGYAAIVPPPESLAGSPTTSVPDVPPAG